MSGLIDWIASKVRRHTREPERPVESNLASGLPGYDSRHGKARAQRYWHRHLSAAARGRKRTLRRIRRESRRANR